jgi:hypothetical protein
MIQLVSILTDSRPPTTPPSYVRGVSAVQKVPETKAAESKGTAQQIHGHLISLKICMSSFVNRDQGLQGVKDRGIDGWDAISQFEYCYRQASHYAGCRSSLTGGYHQSRPDPF